MSEEGLELVLAGDGISTTSAWKSIGTSLTAEGAVEQSYTLDDLSGRAVSSGMIAGHVGRRKHFAIEGERYRFDYGPLKNYGFAQVLIARRFTSGRLLWDTWVGSFAADALDSIISARVYDEEYEMWQNAKDPLQYTTRGRSYAHSKTFTDPLFGRTKIDTSKNPGRRVIRNGYVEAVSATMWLGPLFAERTGANLSVLTSLTWLTVEQAFPGVLKLEAQCASFQTAEGQEGEMQRQLRTVLFPHCDEPA